MIQTGWAAFWALACFVLGWFCAKASVQARSITQAREAMVRGLEQSVKREEEAKNKEVKNDG